MRMRLKFVATNEELFEMQNAMKKLKAKLNPFWHEDNGNQKQTTIKYLIIIPREKACDKE